MNTNSLYTNKSEEIVFEHQLQEIESLPPFPLLASVLKSFLNADDNGDIRPLVANIEQEPSVCAKVLSVANSAFYGGQPSVKSIRDSVNRLGLTRLKSVVFGLIISNKFDTKACPSFDMSVFWYDAMVLAHTSAHITDNLQAQFRLNRNEIYCIALLLNIGLLFLVNTSPKEMENIFKHSDEAGVTAGIRRTFNNLDQYDVGSALLAHWSLPAEFVYTLGQINNSNYKGSCCDIIWLVLLAQQLIADEFKSIETTNRFVGKLNLCDSSFETILTACQNDLGWLKAFAQNF